MKQISHYAVLAVLLTANTLCAQTNNSVSVETPDAAYARVLDDRTSKILAKIALGDGAKSNRVHAVIVQQYRALNDIHTARDLAISAAKANADKAATAASTQAARDAAKLKLDQLHGEFLTKLSRELSAEQVEQVKDGLTYGVLPLTYGVYLKMYPDLTTEQKAQIKAWLTEARELAMDGSTSNEKHAVFGKYKGKINNYLSKAGYDAKQAEQNLKKTSQPPSDAKSK